MASIVSIVSGGLVPAEEIEAQIQELVREAEQVGRRAEAEAMRKGAERLQLPNKPDSANRLVLELRRLVEDEVVVARPSIGEAAIEPNERDREIAKRALMHIKLPQLRQIAGSLSGRSGGKLEEVLETIVRGYHSDQEAIARLVVEYETEPPPERRFATRVFHVTYPEEAQLEQVASRAEHFAGRYMRTGVAKWFVIESVDWGRSRLSMHGTFRAFEATAAKEDDSYRLVSNAANATASLRMVGGQSAVEVDARGTRESRAIMAAFARATGLTWFDFQILPVGGTMAAVGWDQRSAFLVALNANFRTEAIEVFNLTTAGFQSAEASRAEDDDETRPAVRAVKLDGRHLLDSRQACELLADGQGLVELGMLVRFRTSAQEDFLLPVTIRLERDHTTITTGFGTVHPSISRQAHMLIVDGVRQSFRQGLPHVEDFDRLVRHIQAKAKGELGPVLGRSTSGDRYPLG